MIRFGEANKRTPSGTFQDRTSRSLAGQPGRSLLAKLGAAFIISAPISFGVIAGLASCTKETIAVQPPKSCELQIVGLSIIASPTLNPTTVGDSRPVQLRIYQLKSDTRIINAKFDDIWNKDKETLAEDFVSVNEMSIYPDSRTEVKFERNPAALIVVGVALFTNPKGKSWFTSFELPPAPGKGTCAVSCVGDECDAALPPLNPRFSFWIEGSRIDNGDEHLDDVPDGGKVRVVNLAGGSGSAKPGAAPPPAAPKK